MDGGAACAGLEKASKRPQPPGPFSSRGDGAALTSSPSPASGRGEPSYVWWLFPLPLEGEGLGVRGKTK